MLPAAMGFIQIDPAHLDYSSLWKCSGGNLFISWLFFFQYMLAHGLNLMK
jgi:hypothetical protein